MTVTEARRDYAILMANYEKVIAVLEKHTTRTPRKFPRRAALEMFLENMSLTKTAKHFGVSDTAIAHTVHKAFRTARELAGLSPLER